MPFQRSRRRGWDFPICFTVGGNARTAPAKGQDQKSSFQSLPGSGFSISAYWNGWKWPEVPTGTCLAYSWTREIIELN